MYYKIPKHYFETSDNKKNPMFIPTITFLSMTNNINKISHLTIGGILNYFDISSVKRNVDYVKEVLDNLIYSCNVTLCYGNYNSINSWFSLEINCNEWFSIQDYEIDKIIKFQSEIPSVNYSFATLFYFIKCKAFGIDNDKNSFSHITISYNKFKSDLGYTSPTTIRKQIDICEELGLLKVHKETSAHKEISYGKEKITFKTTNTFEISEKSSCNG